MEGYEIWSVSVFPEGNRQKVYSAQVRARSEFEALKIARNRIRSANQIEDGTYLKKLSAEKMD